MNNGEAQLEQQALQSAMLTRPVPPVAPTFENTGQRIAWLREFHGLSLQDFGRRIGYDGSQISRIERNRCHVVDRFIRVVCIQFRVQESWLRLGIGPAMVPSPALAVDVPEAPTLRTENVLETAASQVETLVISSQEWEEAWKDLRSYVDLLDKLSPVARAELAAKLHQLVTRVCAVDNADGMITISARLRENDDNEPAPSTADAASERAPAPVAAKPLANQVSRRVPSARKSAPTGDSAWKFPAHPVGV